MKSDNMWGTEGGQQRLLIATAGVTAAHAEQGQQAHKITLNASSDIFARCSKLSTIDKSRFSVSTSHLHAWLIQYQTKVEDRCGFLPAA